MSGGFTIRELAREAERELGTRRAYYPKMIDKGKIRADLAYRRIDLMEQIAEKLNAEAEQEEAERQQP